MLKINNPIVNKDHYSNFLKFETNKEIIGGYSLKCFFSKTLHSFFYVLGVYSNFQRDFRSFEV